VDSVQGSLELAEEGLATYCEVTSKEEPGRLDGVWVMRLVEGHGSSDGYLSMLSVRVRECKLMQIQACSFGIF
jgi:hypothetical protein